MLFRQAPVDRYDQLAADVERALQDKSAQLRAYHNDGKPTVLLMDFDDIVLLNRDLVATAFARASENRADIEVIDEVYLIDSGRKPVWVYPLKLERRMYPDLPQFREYFSEQYYANYQQ